MVAASAEWSEGGERRLAWLGALVLGRVVWSAVCFAVRAGVSGWWAGAEPSSSMWVVSWSTASAVQRTSRPSERHAGLILTGCASGRTRCGLFQVGADVACDLAAQLAERRP